MGIAREFVDSIAGIESPLAFNPYTDICPIADNAKSPEIRRANLAISLQGCMSAERCSLWIGRDLGYRGGRRTGVALTDEVTLANYGNLIGVEGLQKATVGPVVQERTANVVQTLITRIQRPVFMWNVFPLHPYTKDGLLTNRKHSSHERGISAFAIEWLVAHLRIDMIVAIGRDAQEALRAMGLNAIEARHPSYGGQTEFISMLSDSYALPAAHPRQLPLI